MKKILTFIPLGIGISAAIIYVFNVIQFRIINNSLTLFQILSNLKIYLYISIAGFVCYFIVKILSMIDDKKRVIEVVDNKGNSKETVTDSTYEPFEEINTFKPNLKAEYYKENVNYDYKQEHLNNDREIELTNNNIKNISETKKEPKVVADKNMYCFNCGEKVYNTDSFCSYCGSSLTRSKKHINPILKKIINVLEVVILILIIYFLLNMLFDYKESKDPNFKSPFKVSMTK